MLDIDIQRLRNATPAEQAALLRGYTHIVTVTEQLLTAAASGLISTLTVQIWLSIVLFPNAAVEALQQTHNALVRRAAVPHITKFLRSEESFTDTWDLLGGARSIVAIMSTLSVFDLRRLLTGLLKTAGAKGARRERQERMEELFHLLNDPAENPETRPLKFEYRHIIPACTPEMALQWIDGNPDQEAFPGWKQMLDADSFERDRLKSRITEAHWEVLEQRACDKSFGPTDNKVNMEELRPFLNRSTEFSIRVVEELLRSDTLRGVDPEDLMKKLILHVAKRCVRRPLSSFWSILNNLLQKHPSLANGRWMVRKIYADRLATERSSWGGVWKGSLLECAAARWSCLPRNAEADDTLATLISIIPEKYVLLAGLDEIVFKVPSQKRCDFLRLFYQHACPYKFDIAATQESGTALKGLKMSAITFLQLPSSESADLFERFREANSGYGALFPGVSLGGSGNQADTMSLLNHSGSDDEALKPDGVALRSYLLQRAWCEGDDITATAEKLAVISEDLKTNELPKRKKKAAQGGEPQIRATWAKAALGLCVAIDDLDAYTDTWMWARRFNKDPLTIKSLCVGPVLTLEPTLSLLAVLAATPSARIGNVQEKVLKANKVILLLIQTACMGLREPSFSVHDWETVLRLPSEIVNARLARLDKTQDSLGWTDDEMFDTVLRPSMDLMLNVEALLLKPEHARLRRQNPNGPLETISGRNPSTFRPHVVKFLDFLAQRRDELWRGHRIALNPYVISLEAPWPRGLPIQCLWPWHASQEHLREQTKDAEWIQQRAKAIVFCDGRIALLPAEEDEEERNAIGCFVDSWGDALRIYLAGADGEREKKERLDRVLLHATAFLTGDRMTRQEAERFWLHQFARADVDEKFLRRYHHSDQGIRRPARLPEADQPQVPIEWDPDPSYNETKTIPVRERRLNGVTRLDCMLQAPNLRNRTWESTGPRTVQELVVPGVEAPRISYWNMTWHEKADKSDGPDNQKYVSWKSSTSKAGLVYSRVAAAILCLNSRHGADTSLLMEPFPDGVEQPHFPAVYLDQDFLEREGQDVIGPLQALESSRHAVPPVLLKQLADSLLRRLQAEKNENHRAYQAFVSIVRMMIQGARPNLASPFIQKFIVENMEASGWHRQLFNTGTLNLLPTSDAEDLVISMSEAITDRLQQRQRRQGNNNPDIDTNDKNKANTTGAPLVKVTTVKMIAQILRESHSVKPSLALEVLMRILQNDSHIDIRLAAIEALVHASRDEKLKAQIMNVLEIYAVPLAAALNERSPWTEDAEWEVAESGGDLPVISSQTLVMDMFIQHCNRTAPEFFRLANMALRQLIKKNARWTALFVKKYGLGINPDILPKIPVHPDVLIKLVRNMGASYTSLDEFEPTRSYVLFFLDPPNALRDANKHVRESPEISRSSAGKKWLQLWDKTPKDNLLTYGRSFASCLTEFARAERFGRQLLVPSAMVEEFVMDAAKVLIHQANLSLFEKLRSSIYIEVGGGVARTDAGAGRVIEHLIELIDGLRTPEWQADQRRQPSALPPTLPLRLQLLPFPSQASYGPSSIVDHAAKIINLLREVTESGPPDYHPQYKLIKKCVMTRIAPVLFAVEMGSLSALDRPENPTLVDCLRVKIAAKVLSKADAKETAEKELEAAREMVAGWNGSVVEEFRTLGRSVPSVYKKDGDDGHH